MKRIFTASFILCFSCQSLAAALPDTNNSDERHFYLGIGAAYLFYQSSGNNHLGTGGGWPDDYYSNNSASNAPYMFIVGGYRWQRAENWLPNYSLGLRYMYGSFTTVTGNIDQYSLPSFRNYHYSYEVHLSNLLTLLKADLYRWHNIMPYAVIGAGVAIYSTSNYTEKAFANVTPRVSPGFEHNASTNFAYQFGLGIDYAFRENIVFNIEYDYMNFGTVHTSNGTDYATATGTNYDNESLKNQMYATALLAGINFYIA